MPIDKSWISKPRNTREYANGLTKFLDFAFRHKSIEGRIIKCPCSKCGFKKWQTRHVVQEHLTCRPFPENYKVWYFHGEESNVIEHEAFENTHVIEDTLQPQNQMENMINDAFGFVRHNVDDLSASFEHSGQRQEETHNEENADFYKLMEDSNKKLYEGCTKYSKLSFLVKLYHIKCLCRMSDKAMTMILELLNDAFEDAKIPSSIYEAKKIINKLGLNYTKIPACPNDCKLYWGEENEGLEECKRCKTSKWRDNKKKQPAKILRYFPLKPRLQRLFMCSKTVESMKWHAKSLSPLDLDRLQARIILTLCHLEMLFPPSFFTIMVHLTCHPVGEAKLGGPIHYRWMYPIERYLGHLKSYVRNKAQPEGSIAEGYLAEEVLTFCSQYIEGMETRINRPARVDDCPDDRDSSYFSTIFPPIGKVVGAFSTFELSTLEKTQAHRYVLLNCPQVKPYIDEFKEHLWRRSKGRKRTTTEIEKMVNKDFIEWFPRRIMNPDISSTVSDDLKFLAKGPTPYARRFSAFNINGFKFRTVSREHGLKTQNSGVFLSSSTSCVASSVDGNIREADLSYYGKLEDIIELNYYGCFKVTLLQMG